MEQIKITPQLLKYFHSASDMLIFEGYCRYSDNAVVFREGDNYALVVKVKDVYKCCFATDDLSFVDEVISPLKGNVELCGVDPQITDYLRDKYAFEYETHCYLYVWNGEPLPHKCVLKTQPLLPKYAQKASDGTHYHAAPSEICECLEMHPSAAIYIDDEPVCWCLCHLEKSLGMLYTMPEHRHKGYALEVMTSLCNQLISRGDVPYAYIVTDNVASLNLAKKYNLTKVKNADYFRFTKTK